MASTRIFLFHQATSTVRNFFATKIVPSKTFSPQNHCGCGGEAPHGELQPQNCWDGSTQGHDNPKMSWGTTPRGDFSSQTWPGYTPVKYALNLKNEKLSDEKLMQKNDDELNKTDDFCFDFDIDKMKFPCLDRKEKDEPILNLDGLLNFALYFWMLALFLFQTFSPQFLKVSIFSLFAITLPVTIPVFLRKLLLWELLLEELMINILKRTFQICFLAILIPLRQVTESLICYQSLIWIKLHLMIWIFESLIPLRQVTDPIIFFGLYTIPLILFFVSNLCAQIDNFGVYFLLILIACCPFYCLTKLSTFTNKKFLSYFWTYLGFLLSSTLFLIFAKTQITMEILLQFWILTLFVFHLFDKPFPLTKFWKAPKTVQYILPAKYSKNSKVFCILQKFVKLLVLPEIGGVISFEKINKKSIRMKRRLKFILVNLL